MQYCTLRKIHCDAPKVSKIFHVTTLPRIKKVEPTAIAFFWQQIANHSQP
ncbi:hypothetical protein AM1_D0061 (plasmid) [Acaryochloris marina MBIC11017]|uniref:Uncharacterized protein n=1 Tax=Acaryochloris marina (strain MBIC 11017) TaxID=329726 RepID=A8ZNH0_ACAM1|nr:hypothetical protein AM1_D0061 [Acaryochloris marina MBIC11017]